MHNVLLPAEASLDIYKGAFVLKNKYSLPYQAFQFIYPNKYFVVRNGDVLLGVNMEVHEKVIKFTSFQEVLDYCGDDNNYELLNGVPEFVLYGFLRSDKTETLIELFKFFERFIKNYTLTKPLNEIVDEYDLIKFRSYKIVVQKNRFITPNERLALFRHGVDYIVFESNGTVGIQKTLAKPTPSLYNIKLPDEVEWFKHKKGHLIISKSKVDNVDLFKLVDILTVYLKELDDSKNKSK